MSVFPAHPQGTPVSQAHGVHWGGGSRPRVAFSGVFQVRPLTAPRNTPSPWAECGYAARHGGAPGPRGGPDGGQAVSDPEPPPLASSPSCLWGVRGAQPRRRVHPPAEIPGPLAERPGALLPETQAAAPGAWPDRLPKQPAGVSRAAFLWSEAGPAASSPAGGPLPGGPAHTVFLELKTDTVQTPVCPWAWVAQGTAISTLAPQLSQVPALLWASGCQGAPDTALSLSQGSGIPAELSPECRGTARPRPDHIAWGPAQPGFPGPLLPGAHLLLAGRCVTVH